jgi:hypothetical protein
LSLKKVRSAWELTAVNKATLGNNARTSDQSSGVSAKTKTASAFKAVTKSLLPATKAATVGERAIPIILLVLDTFHGQTDLNFHASSFNLARRMDLRVFAGTVPAPMASIPPSIQHHGHIALI